MSDLIDRKKTIDAIKKEWEEPLHSGETWEIIERTCDRIHNLPSAEPKKGRWTPKEQREKQEIFICSECGGWAYSPWVGSRKNPKPNRCKYRYCPHCGARMEETE